MLCELVELINVLAEHKMQQKRGLVISNPVSVDNNNVYASSVNLDPQELRFSLLFWDELAWPRNNVMDFGFDANDDDPDQMFDPDVALLQEEGILTRPRVRVQSSGGMSELFSEAHVRAFLELDNREPGKWALAQGSDSFLLNSKIGVPDRGLTVTLHRAIPVPDKEVALQDVLLFRDRRRAELLNLRQKMDSYYGDLLNSADKSFFIRKYSDDIADACKECISGARGIIPFRFSDLSISFDLGRAAAFAAGSLMLGKFSLDEGAILGISLGISIGRKNTTTKPFRYVSSFHNEVF